MILLNDILKNVAVINITGSTVVTVSALQIDSRAVQSGDAFIAVKGTLTDGHKFIASCIEKGARVIICETLPDSIDQTVTYVQVANSAKALGLLASNFYGNPSSQMKVVGVTGTNGKTSTVTLLYRLFRALGHKAGLLSTVENQING